MRTLKRALLHSLSLLILSVRVSHPVCVDGVSDTEAVLGKPMKLTCISCLKREDIRAVTRVYWSRVTEDERIPIYEYVDGPRELDSLMKGRLLWIGSKDLQDVSVRITNITRNDSGRYECEVFRQFEFDFFTPSITSTKVIKLEVKERASVDPTALYSEIMMYVLLVSLTGWLLVEMVYCYRKISKSDEQAQDAVTDYLAVPSDKEPPGPAVSD
ncbi:sodium channel subunit beta-3 [Clupea harengus]|uniref:Sodium channel regulatory subunit beta-3 n=1 Tax=Clupea harengus TaxID=7950 RepID=A0A6P8GYW8_CLUHA|nr:sodium channel subunit beta-3 [Clupea harengus]